MRNRPIARITIDMIDRKGDPTGTRFIENVFEHDLDFLIDDEQLSGRNLKRIVHHLNSLKTYRERGVK